MPQKILVVDDEPYLAELVSTALRYEGYQAATAGTCAAARRLVPEFRPDLLVLDIALPDGSGLDLCRRLRAERCEAPVIFLTARDATEDKISGLTSGADDYVTKPFSLDELIARIQAVLRRTSGAGDDILRFADLEVNDRSYEVFRHGRPVDLTPTEFKLLRYLVVNAGTVLTKRQVLEHVWAYDFTGGDGVVQTYISYLRRKIDTSPPRLIHTVPRVGYVIRLPKEIPGQEDGR